MRLAEILAARPRVGGGVLVMLTGRCPLRCAHCSTASTMAGAHTDARRLRRFFATLDPTDHPSVAMLTGGEPLLRPDLVVDLARTAATAGTRTAVLTGAFFARSARVAPPILRAMRAVDHVSVSLDAFHEREVPRTDVFRLLRTLLDLGTAVSLHVVGADPTDPYLVDVTSEVRGRFGTHVPMLVTAVRAAGRAAGWAASSSATAGTDAAEPCTMAAWPVVAVDGAILACCNQGVVDGPDRPAHLLLGDLGVDGWPDVRERADTSAVLRMIRVLGPRQLRARAVPADPAQGAGYCGSCHQLAARPDVAAWTRTAGGGPAGALLDRCASGAQIEAGPVALVRRYGCPAYAELVDLDRPLDRPTVEGSPR